jgi:hypothetical protein
LNIKLAMTLAQFIDIFEDLRTWIVDQANKGINSTSKITKRQLFMKNVTEGSVDTISALSVGNLALVSQIANQINQGLASEPKIGSTGIAISGSAVANVAAPTTESSATSLGLILGITLPLGLLFLVALIVIIWKMKSRKNDEDEENYK